MKDVGLTGRRTTDNEANKTTTPALIDVHSAVTFGSMVRMVSKTPLVSLVEAALPQRTAITRRALREHMGQHRAGREGSVMSA